MSIKKHGSKPVSQKASKPNPKGGVKAKKKPVAAVNKKAPEKPTDVNKKNTAKTTKKRVAKVPVPPAKAIKGKIGAKGDTNPRHYQFVCEYVTNGFKVGEAYKTVYGVTGRNAVSAGSRLLSYVDVQEMIAAEMGRRGARYALTADRTLKEIALLAHANVMDFITVQGDGTAFVDLSRMTREQAAAVAEITVDQYTELDPTCGPDGKELFRPVKKIKVKLANKLAALEMLCKHFQIFTAAVAAAPNQFTTAIVNAVLEGKKDVLTAAYELTAAGLPLPKLLEREVSKQEAAPPEPGKAITVEELDELYYAALEEERRQREKFLPERQAEVAELKKQLTGRASFKPSDFEEIE